MADATKSRVIGESLRGYQRSWLRPDVLAGLTVWAVMVPESLAFAVIAGVPPVVGLYAAAPALLLYPLIGSSRHLIVGPLSSTAVLSATMVTALAHGNTARYVAFTSAIAVVTGMLAVVAGLARLGFIASFISEPVLKGFIVGLSLTIIVGQLPKLLGVPKREGGFFRRAWAVITELGHAHGLTALVGVASLVIVLVLRRYLPLVPGSLIVVLGGIGAVAAFHLDRRGLDVVGPIKSGLPRIGLPSGLSASNYLDLVGPAVGILLVGFAEALGAAKTYAAKAGYTVDANRELGGIGLSNLGSGLCSGMVVSGSLSKTAVNGGAGAKSQVSGLTAAVLVVVTLLFLTGLFEKLPEATLAGVVITAVIDLVDFSALRGLYRVWTRRLGSIYGPAARVDFIAAVAALLGVLIFDTLPGLIIGIAVSVLLLLYRASRPAVVVLVQYDNRWVDAHRFPDAPRRADVLVARVESGLFFANADHVRDRITDLVTDDTHVVVLDAETSPFIDVTAATMLVDLHTALARRGIDLRIAMGIGQFRDVLIGIHPSENPPRVFNTIADAIAAPT